MNVIRYERHPESAHITTLVEDSRRHASGVGRRAGYSALGRTHPEGRHAFLSTDRDARCGPERVEVRALAEDARAGVEWRARWNLIRRCPTGEYER